MEEEENEKPKKKVTIQDAESGDEFLVVGRGSKVVKPVEKLTSASLFEKLDEILAARGKKNTDKSAQIDSISALVDQAFSPYQKIKCLMSLISARFDYVPASSGVMSTEMWKASLDEIKALHDLLDENPHITIGDVVVDDSVSENARDKVCTYSW
jgi:translation initiation factor 3 subunit C